VNLLLDIMPLGLNWFNVRILSLLLFGVKIKLPCYAICALRFVEGCSIYERQIF